MKNAYLTTGLIVGILLTMNPLSPLQAQAQITFSDLEETDPSKEAITYLKEGGIVEGYSDGTFRSTHKINRAEFMKVVIGILTNTPGGSFCFSDVNEEWFAPYICEGKTRGLVSGYDDGSFHPEAEINFAEASKILSHAFELKGETQDKEWYASFVSALDEENAIPTSISDFDKFIARGEMAEMVWRIEEKTGKTIESLKYEELKGTMVNIESCEELKELFLSNPYDYPPITIYEEMDGDSVGTEPESSPTEDTSNNEVKSSNDYSTTNIQVSGVDESDSVKNDGQYIYTIHDQIVEIVEAYPLENLRSVSKIEFANENEFFRPSQLYLDGDTLVVIGYQSTYKTYDYDYEYKEIWFPEYHQNRTGVYIYDVSDRSNPTLQRNLTLDGSYSNSRKVDDTLYVILNKYDFPYYGYDPETLNVEEVLPRYYDSLNGEEKVLADCTDIRYMPRERTLNYIIASAIPIDADTAIDSEVLIGNSENLYSSRENLYIASTNYESDDYYLDWGNAKTWLYRFGLNPGKITYERRAKVPGTILNQFSMDEHANHFRIATTQHGSWNWMSDIQTESSNNFYVLDENMETVGQIENIAPGEQLYSTRFMGDRGYLVTFKQIDPFFVMDLSEPTAPKIVGELKIPGYSTYLHPYDENHILGFGKDATDAETEGILEEEASDMNWAWYQGMKVGLFDVTDPTNPKQIFSVGIGDRGTESELLYNHKALLFNASKNLLAFPISVTEVSEKYANDPMAYGETVFQGAYVYTIDLENGFTPRGTITHYEESEEGNHWDWYDYLKEISRILYIDEHLYTVSEGIIKASNILTTEQQGELILETSSTDIYDYPEGEIESESSQETEF